MLKLLIAEDEKVIRESLAECIDWGALGVQVTACCANGIEALESCLDEIPDIVLTDIKMPGLNGLELIEQLKRLDMNMEIIILSCFREFEYAQRSMAFGVRQYLLKPVDEMQLIAAVKDAKRSLSKRSVARVASSDADGRGNELIRSVKEYVEANLSDSGLSLKEIASQHIYLNPDYLSRLFVQVTGEKFSHYLNRTRIETAMDLLAKDAAKVYLVAEQVGCGHNPRYFSQVFKKYAGMTPTAFVERVKARGE